MTNQEQNIAIAEACGWRYLPRAPAGKQWVYGDKDYITYGQMSPPPYTADLNAMHEAEGALSPQDLWIYENKLPGYLRFRATAAHRSEAFLKTLNLWKD